MTGARLILCCFAVSSLVGLTAGTGTVPPQANVAPPESSPKKLPSSVTHHPPLNPPGSKFNIYATVWSNEADSQRWPTFVTAYPSGTTILKMDANLVVYSEVLRWSRSVLFTGVVKENAVYVIGTSDANFFVLGGPQVGLRMFSETIDKKGKPRKKADIAHMVVAEIRAAEGMKLEFVPDERHSMSAVFSVDNTLALTIQLPTVIQKKTSGQIAVHYFVPFHHLTGKEQKFSGWEIVKSDTTTDRHRRAFAILMMEPDNVGTIKFLHHHDWERLTAEEKGKTVGWVSGTVGQAWTMQYAYTMGSKNKVKKKGVMLLRHVKPGAPNPFTAASSQSISAPLRKNAKISL